MAAIQPNILGVRVQAVHGDQILVNNLLRTPVVILDPAGRPFIHVPSGESHTWHDVRVVATADPPRDPGQVKQWRIPGRAAGTKFAINGFVAWVPPEQSSEEGVPPWLLAGLALGLVALSAGAVFLLGRSA